MPDIEIEVKIERRIIEVVAAGQTTIVSSGAIQPRVTQFSVPAALWRVEHNLDRVPLVFVTDLIGNVLSVSIETTTTAIVVEFASPMVGFLYYV